MCIAEELFNTDTGERVSSPRHPRHRGKIRERKGGQVAAIYPFQAYVLFKCMKVKALLPGEGNKHFRPNEK